ncbi:MAG: MFS transporter [Endozoicomonas sp. (ex Botrylloides leachii)]|nr:MFS transporter [Endozoicomonas sp. (ex Botrylloides leachii)]
MSKPEIKAACSLTLVFVFRMLGLFMVLPVLALYTEDLSGVTPTLAGLAIGAYGFSQALLQIPFGWLSDRIGRKPVIISGLLLFMVGSLVAAYASNIHWIIIGRLLQGCGAIAGAITALMADLTREQYRTRAMAMIGIGIGISFCLAMILGPIISGIWDLSGLFLSNVLMSVAAIFIVIFLVPSPVVTRKDLNSSVQKQDIGKVIHNTQLMRHFVGVFTLHFTLMALFVFVPQVLEQDAGYPRADHGWIYLAVMSISFIAIIPLIIFSEKHRRLKQCYVGAITVIIAAVIVLSQGERLPNHIFLGLILFFMAFNFLEATLPSLVSKLSKAGTRGTAMGMFSTCQFLGAALGGVSGGWALQHGGVTGVLIVCIIPIAIWWLLSVTMKHPPYVSSIVMALFPHENNATAAIDDAQALSKKMASIPGVEEVTVLPEERTAYLKVDKRHLDISALQRFGEC